MNRLKEVVMLLAGKLASLVKIGQRQRNIYQPITLVIFISWVAKFELKIKFILFGNK